MIVHGPALKWCPSLRTPIGLSLLQKTATPASTYSKSFPDLTFRRTLQDPKRTRAEMVAPTPIMGSGLIAVCLIIRSKEGPRFVYHHPPRPTLQASHREYLYGTDLDESGKEEKTESVIDSDDSDLEDGEYAIPQIFGKLNINNKSKVNTSHKSSHVEPLEGDDHYDTKWGEHVVPWEQLFEYSTTDLESILTPSRAFHKKKFELCLDPLHFVSYPMHIREDGLWKKRKLRKAKKSKKEKEEPGDEGEKNGDGKPIDNTSEDGDDYVGMTMFNVVFVLNVSKEQVDSKILEIYEHVIKKFNKALSHAQAQGNYVWKESEMILGMKEKAREERRTMSWLWNEISLRSTLAGAIRDVFTAISNNKIATVQLATTPPLNLSLQIPIPSFLTSLPSSNERAMPGLLVTTANPLVDEEGNEDPTHLNKHFALLLLDDEDKIMSEIQSDNTELSAPLIECIRLCKPTLSFLQVAQINSIEVGSLLILTQHLIYWRKAIAILPLHARETYFVSPNCDTRKLPEASIAWKKAFPLSPSLPTFLATLSSAPRPYKTFAPSKNHRPTYIDMLAWLIRGGWVTQLRTFAWILVWPEIIYEVEYQLKSDALEKAKKKLKSETASSESTESTDESGGDKKSIDCNAPMTTEQTAENARLERLAKKAADEAAEEAEDFSKMPLPVATAHPSNNNAAHLKRISPYIIKDPHKVSHEESLYIAALGKRLTDPRAKDCWGKFAKYFNGTEALEMIPLREGIKRKETWGILLNYQEHILICKHW